MKSNKPIRRAPHRATSLAALAVIAFASSACATAAPGGGKPGGGRRAPPTEAIDACKALTAGDACSFSQGDTQHQGSCWAPEGKPLACRPDDAPAPGSDAPKSGSK